MQSLALSFLFSHPFFLSCSTMHVQLMRYVHLFIYNWRLDIKIEQRHWSPNHRYRKIRNHPRAESKEVPAGETASRKGPQNTNFIQVRKLPADGMDSAVTSFRRTELFVWPQNRPPVHGTVGTGMKSGTCSEVGTERVEHVPHFGRNVTSLLCSPPCENGGQCLKDNTCQCTPSFTGDRCQQRGK